MRTSTAVALLCGIVLLAVSAIQAGEVRRSEVAGEMIVAFETGTSQVDLDAVIKSWDLQLVAPGFSVIESKLLLQWLEQDHKRETVVAWIRFPATLDAPALIKAVTSQDDVVWSAPNYRYTGDVKELDPNDPLYEEQYHHRLMRNHLAWDFTMGVSTVIIAITDDGFKLDHEDLSDSFWINPDEIAGNNIDDDNNGYIDDVNGWDFVHGDNDPRPDSDHDDHGTHVAGIAGARTNNIVGVAGTAGAAMIMPLQFYSEDEEELWTSNVIAETFTYAVDNGAHIINTSYNINSWVYDPTVTAAFQYLYDKGVLHINSAGNDYQKNPPRQAFHQTLLVANTNDLDVKTTSSNYGTGIDMAAPGWEILSTSLAGGYTTKSGTSMSAPNAAGVAALIWSLHPSWTRDQVAAQLYATADNIDLKNLSFDPGLLGGGRVNAGAALTTGELPAPQVNEAIGIPVQGKSDYFYTFTLRFDQIMAPATVNDAGAFSLLYAGPDGTFDTADDKEVLLSWSDYLIGSNEVAFTIGQALTSGWYRLRANVENPFGTALLVHEGGAKGDPWERTFAICRRFSPSGCSTCSGDMDGDFLAGDADIVTFLECYIEGAPGTPGCECAEMDGNGVFDKADLSLFVNAMLEKQLPVMDDFTAWSYDKSKWLVVDGATIDDVGIAEPSAPYAARLNGQPAGGDSIVTYPLNLSGQSAVYLTYNWQRTGGGDSTESGDDLFVEYLADSLEWQTIHQHPGSGPPMPGFKSENGLLPMDALHDAFQLRFRCTSTGGQGDDWFVDDLLLAP